MYHGNREWARDCFQMGSNPKRSEEEHTCVCLFVCLFVCLYLNVCVCVYVCVCVSL